MKSKWWMLRPMSRWATPAVLAELRELALLLAADVVDRQLQEYLDSHGVSANWGTQERILVCLTPRSNARAMLESGRAQRGAIPRGAAGGLRGAAGIGRGRPGPPG